MKKDLLIAILMFGILICGNAYADLNDGLVAYYPFNGNANDESGNGNHGSVYGALLATDRFGNSNSAYQFDGVNDSIVMMDSASLDVATAFTLIAWVFVDGPNSGYPDQGIISKVGGDSGNFGYQMGLVSPSENEGTVFVHFNSDEEQWPGNSLIKGKVYVREWTNIVSVYDGNELSTYINGIFQGSVEIGQKNISNSLSNLRISGDDNLHAYFNGFIDDIRIYNRALSYSEIQQIYIGDDHDYPDGCSQTELNAQYEAGKQYCINNPEACGISVNGGEYTQSDLIDARQEGYDEGYQAGISNCNDNSVVVTDSNCATFDLFTNVLTVPCLDMGTVYWLELQLENDHLRIDGFGEVE